MKWNKLSLPVVVTIGTDAFTFQTAIIAAAIVQQKNITGVQVILLKCRDSLNAVNILLTSARTQEVIRAKNEFTECWVKDLKPFWNN